MDDINDILDNGHTLLTDAIENHMIDEILNLIEKGADLNKENSERQTPLMIAINHLNVDIVKILVENNVDVNYKFTLFSYDFTPIRYLTYVIESATPDDNFPSVLRNKYTDIFNLLINAGAIIDDHRFPPGKRNYILLFHMKHNNIEIISKLIEKGIDINQYNETFGYPISYAINNSEYKTIKLLIDNKVLVRLSNYDNNYVDVKTYELILRCGRMDNSVSNAKVKSELEYVSIKKLNSEYSEFSNLQLSKNKLLYKKLSTFDRQYIVSTYKSTTLNNFMALSIRGYYGLIKSFLNKLEDQVGKENIIKLINIQDSTGNTALHYACVSAKKYDDINIINVLMKWGANKYIKNNTGYDFYYYLKNFPELVSLKSKYEQELSDYIYSDPTSLYSYLPKDVSLEVKKYI
jgi:ankyrin repeat protein